MVFCQRNAESKNKTEYGLDGLVSENAAEMQLIEVFFRGKHLNNYKEHKGLGSVCSCN